MVWAFADAVKSGGESQVGSRLPFAVLVGGSKPVAPRGASAVAGGCEREFARTPLPEFVANIKVSAGLIKKDEIEWELRGANPENSERWGGMLSHLDSHKHTHAHPKVMDVVGKGGAGASGRNQEKSGGRWRICGSSWQTTRRDAEGVTKQIAAAAEWCGWWRRDSDAFVEKYKLTCPDYFLGLAMTGQLGPAALSRMAESVEEG